VNLIDDKCTKLIGTKRYGGARRVAPAEATRRVGAVVHDLYL